MHTFYYPGHVRHDPGQLHRSDTPHKNRFLAETAQRGTLIHEAIKAANFGPITPPGDFGIEPITDIHNYQMLHLLQNAHLHIKQGGGLEPVADTFSVRGNPSRIPRSFHGQLGYFSFDVYSPIFEDTWDVAYWSVQTAVSAAALILAGEKSVYALCRPPGHHTATDLFGGYCYLNNAAIAANWLVQQGQRLAILDIDYHHGNGTQEIFYNSPDTLVCSIHADPLSEYPYFWGFADEFGAGPGENYNFNFPLPRGTREVGYTHAFEEALKKIRLFVPDVLLISFGTDTFDGDPIGGFKLQTDTYARLGQRLGSLGLPLLIIQEGGYALETLGQNVVAFLDGILHK
jgi:acetoin utilization deacetylase AcuC-like enzyme